MAPELFSVFLKPVILVLLYIPVKKKSDGKY